MPDRPALAISVRRLHVDIEDGSRRPLQLLRNLSLDVAAGECVGIVGESGCGKTTLARALCGLQQVSTGTITIAGHDITARARRSKQRAWRRHVQMVFQDPASSLDPQLRVAQLLAEPLRALRPELSGKQRAALSEQALSRVGLDAGFLPRRPAALSGGQAQRVAIARAMVVEPSVLILDEPLSSLDVSVGAQIINLLRELRASTNMAILVIAHDLAAVRHLCDRVHVMYLGEMVEQGRSIDVFGAPSHPYTRALLSCVPDVSRPVADRILLQGELPDLSERPSGCGFRTRCPMVDNICAQEAPAWHRQNHGGYSACHFAANYASPMTTRRFS